MPVLLANPTPLSQLRGLCLPDSAEKKKKKKRRRVGRGGKKTAPALETETCLVWTDQCLQGGRWGRPAMMRDQLRDISLATELFGAEAK